MNQLVKRNGLLFVVIVCGSCSSSSFAENKPPVKPTSVKSLAWLAGGWSSTVGGRTTEEHWIAPQGGVMLGLNRSVSKSRRTSFEFLRISETPTGIVYFASPSGRPATPFALTEAKANRAVFSNPKNAFPQTIIYERTGKTLKARIEGTIQGRRRMIEWNWTRQANSK